MATAAAAAGPTDISMLSVAGSSCYCLIVDSNQQLQRLIHGFLTSLSIRHTQVYDGEHALSTCVQDQYDLIFLDLDAVWDGPVKSGLDAACNVRFQGQNTTTPIVGWTGQLELQGDTRAWRDAGINDIVLKPFSKENIVEMISRWGSGAGKMEPLPQPDVGNFSVLELAELPPPDFVTTDLVRPKTARVLVVEDCTLTQHIICSLLKKLTNHVEQAFDGEQAIVQCSQTAFDIIFMDIHMPKVNGLEATHHIRNTSNLNLYTPIIAFTSTGTLEEYKTFGVNDLLAKPFTTESLSDKFDKWTPFSKSMMDITADPTFSLDAASPGSGTEPVGNALPTLGSLTQASPPHQMDAMLNPQSPMSLGGTASAAAASRKPKSMSSARSTKDDRREASGSWPKKAQRKGSNLGHTAKEKMRRASIALSCNSLRSLVPSCKDADKATVFRTSAEYIAFLRKNIPPQQLHAWDQKFVDNLEIKNLEEHSAGLKLDDFEQRAMDNSEMVRQLSCQGTEAHSHVSTAAAAHAAALAVDDFA
eukprot:m.39020 g.39020  ORF g.39020 m.39020 type:complete len:531 (-) comp11228_c0_seq2:253-1845(-)